MTKQVLRNVMAALRPITGVMLRSIRPLRRRKAPSKRHDINVAAFPRGTVGPHCQAIRRHSYTGRRFAWKSIRRQRTTRDRDNRLPSRTPVHRSVV